MTIRKTKKLLYNTVIICAIIASMLYVSSRFIHFGNIEYTDNAQTKRHITPINTRISGFIKEIRFEEFQQVNKGDTLVIIEDTEFRLRVAQAEADLENALAGRSAINAEIKTTTNNLSVSDAVIEGARVQMENSKRDWQRFEKLLKEESVTSQQYDNARKAYESTKAAYHQVLRTRQSTSLIKDEQTHRLGQTEAVIKLAEAAVELAQLNLSYTIITSPCNGVTGKREIHEGELVQPGQNIVNIVDNNDIWIIANYRESQMSNIKKGCTVEIIADAVPGITYTGIVESISDATGTSFSTLPQDNATGNFVKVEQRIPVRISLKGNNTDNLVKLRAGLNVECSVNY